jgi:phosphoglycolate phosphatase-like HAD superfamily hydrolase
VANTRFEVAVFDFDGTLVQSAERKHQAFFDIFPPECGAAVASVLATHPETSRYDVIPLIIAEAERRGMTVAVSVADLISAYSAEAMASVADAPELPGAGRIIRAFAQRMATFLLSATPTNDLAVLLAKRGWTPHFSGVFGYPSEKTKVVASLLSRYAIAPSRLLMIGDGTGDLLAARANGCEFFRVEHPEDLARALAFADITDA